MNEKIKKAPPNFKSVYCCSNCRGKLEEDGKWKTSSVNGGLFDDECCVCGKSPTNRVTLVDRF